MRYVIFGAGAVGGVVGGLLHKAGIDVTLVARGEHLRAIQDAGLSLDTPDGLLTLAVPAVEEVSEVKWTDDTVVLLSVKGQQTETALESLAAYAPAETPVVAVQNGVANEPRILRRFARTYAIHVVLPATFLTPGSVVQGSGNTPGILDIGRFPTGVDETAAAIAGDLVDAGFLSEPRADIMAWKYRKLLNNLGNGINAAIAPGPSDGEIYRRCLAEAETVLAAAGISVVSAEEDRTRRADHITERDRPSNSSTWQSLARGSGVEIDYLSGEIVLLGRLHDVPTPVNEAIQRAVHEIARTGAEPGSLDGAEFLAGL
ncbi:2-dehydropantoate 2-reductase [Nocardioides luteus]|uniref:2-dehydropantoate 2-reductase n=1 Tax=Nocardioides luteus TaxID=1844 RepID=A0ABQ5SWI8_9ACTN|nr:2-dehydropantoate 2-reductase [Nocardioides luteus]MDR7312088.1 2-dehydropantoate 2-reductase [Nocardioides luteus]GGR55996.1 2-dehydropantoate 2-reductase [Nocardioides luteus]GLJ68334.1 2-dehydropantoate 2-reductase [Nocardioides luteus]